MNEAQTRHERTYNLVAGTTSDVEFMHFPTPNELLDVLERSNDESLLEKICREIPFMAKTRYYQERAVEAVIKALGRGKKNALITLATGTGKTYDFTDATKKFTDPEWDGEVVCAK